MTDRPPDTGPDAIFAPETGSAEEPSDGGDPGPESSSPQGSFGRESISGVTWQATANGIQFVARFGISAILARLLFPEDFGIVAIATVALGFAFILTDLGFGPALIQRRTISQAHVRVCLTVSTSAALVVGCLLFAFAVPIAGIFDEPRVAPVLRVLSLALPLAGLTATSRALLARALRFRSLVKIQLATSLLASGGVSLALAWAGFGYWALVAGQLAELVLQCVLMYGAVRHSLKPLFDATAFRDLFGFSLGMSLSGIVNYFAGKGDYFVIGTVMDAASLGFYTRAYSLMELPLRFMGLAIDRVMFPLASKVQDQPERFRTAFMATFSLSTAFALPVSLLLAGLAPELIPALYGDKWDRTVPLLQILSLFGAFRMTFQAAIVFVRARGQVYRVLTSQILYAVCVVGGSWYGARQAGLEGVAWAVGIAIFVMWSIVVFFAVRAAGLSPGRFVRSLIPVVLPAVGLSAVVWIAAELARAAGLGKWMVLLICLPLFGVLFLWHMVAQASRVDHPAINALLARLRRTPSA